MATAVTATASTTDRRLRPLAPTTSARITPRPSSGPLRTVRPGAVALGERVETLPRRSQGADRRLAPWPTR
ncbi:MAG: hypothetical protein B7Z69_07590 [Actinobacteria bacterium 21-73-9]|nr:MAG: hypothetical protein B7Z69_07590 [Actinobacteria bacterium 21-73-9]